MLFCWKNINCAVYCLSIFWWKIARHCYQEMLHLFPGHNVRMLLLCQPLRYVQYVLLCYIIYMIQDILMYAFCAHCISIILCICKMSIKSIKSFCDVCKDIFISLLKSIGISECFDLLFWNLWWDFIQKQSKLKIMSEYKARDFCVTYTPWERYWRAIVTMVSRLSNIS